MQRLSLSLLLVLLFCLLIVALSACALPASEATATSLPPSPTATVVRTPAPVASPTPPTAITRTPDTSGPTASQLGLYVDGYVRLPDGKPLANVSVYLAFASYKGNVIAKTNQDGYYKSDFIYIPGDEMVRVWAELDKYKFEPDGKVTWADGNYYWRHYYGLENSTLSFIARPIP